MKKFYLVLPFVVAIIRNEKGEILVGQTPDTKLKPYPKKWDLPGGKVEPFETPEEGLIRELKEETNLDITNLILHKVCHHYGDHPDCTNKIPALGMCYTAEASGKLISTEMDNMQYMTINNFIKLDLVPGVKYFLEDLK
ncbi:MAG: NUDIX domain-containing protein [Patescibacteria group bacterium]